MSGRMATWVNRGAAPAVGRESWPVKPPCMLSKECFERMQENQGVCNKDNGHNAGHVPPWRHSLRFLQRLRWHHYKGNTNYSGTGDNFTPL